MRTARILSAAAVGIIAFGGSCVPVVAHASGLSHGSRDPLQPRADDWVGDNAGFAALPGVQAFEDRIAALLRGPLKVTEIVTTTDSLDTYIDDVLISRGGVTREANRSKVTYTSATEVCSRRVTRKRPWTIDQDRRARFTCSARTDQTVDPMTAVANLRPTVAINAGTSSTSVIVAGVSALSATTSDLHGWVYEQQHLKPDTGAFYTGHADGSVSVSGMAVNADPESYDVEVVLSSRKVPRLPAMSTLHRA